MKIDLETVTLRRLELTDAPAIRAALEDGRVAQTLSRVPHPYPEGAEFAYIEAAAQDAFAAVSDNNTFLGLGRYTKPRFCDYGDKEFGYWVRPDYWGQGIGTRIIGLLLEKAHSEKLKLIVARTLKDNKASNRIFEKHGFKIVSESTHWSASREAELPDYGWEKSLK